jgi:predicted Ser/Thr protein kinase
MLSIKSIADNVEKRFKTSKRVLSFAEYCALFEKQPIAYSRDASRYLRDTFDHYGTTKVKHPWGEVTRFKMFDAPWETKSEKENGLPKNSLIGQEHVQEDIYRALSNFVREGRSNRLVFLHGPNGSAKSTIAQCMMSALENYSTLDDGALYRFNWIFPSKKTIKGTLGFGNEKASDSKDLGSYAHLPDDDVDAKLIVEVRDHPLFLIPIGDREKLLREAFKGETPNDWILKGQLSHKSQQVFEALLSSYEGSYAEVLRHVQVERYFITRRYRTGAVTVGPQLSVDASEHQITADRSIQSLPASLKAVSLYEAKGELIDAAGGLLEFSDLLKRPLEAFKYLQVSIETGEVGLSSQNVQLNCVMMGSANELHFDAFREHPEFASFRGRLDLVRMPYLRSYEQERVIYETYVAPQIQRHIAPHAIEMAAVFAVLTRMRKPNPDRYSGTSGLPAIIVSLSAVEKADLYSIGKVPERLDADGQKTLRAAIKDIWNESNIYPIYEGRVGASPREMRVTLLDAAQSNTYRCLNPQAVLEEIDALCERTNEFEWLQQSSIDGGYHEMKTFRDVLFNRLLDASEYELYVSSGLVNDEQYAELFSRYITNVNAWIKKERLYNPIMQRHEEADEKVMGDVEKLLDVKIEAEEWRKQIISMIAAWSIDNPGQKVDAGKIFPQYLKRMRETIFSERKKEVALIARDVVVLVREDGSGLDKVSIKKAEDTITRLTTRFGYCRSCAGDMTSLLVRNRFQDLVV